MGQLDGSQSLLMIKNPITTTTSTTITTTTATTKVQCGYLYTEEENNITPAILADESLPRDAR